MRLQPRRVSACATLLAIVLATELNAQTTGLPHNYFSDGTFGQIINMETPPTSVLGSGLGAGVPPRMIQLKAQLQF
jgi:hypothetical protein